MSRPSSYRIKIFADFCSTNECKAHYERVCQVHLLTNYGPQKEIWLVSEQDQHYSHVIILNCAMPPLLPHIKKKHVLGLACEPLAFLKLTQKFINYAQQYIGRYLIGTLPPSPSPFKLPVNHPFEERYSYMWHATPLQLNYTQKTKPMSIIFSRKMNAPGHKYRHQLVQAILKTDLPIDIYGRGCALYTTPLQQTNNTSHAAFSLSNKNTYTKKYIDHRLKGNFTDERVPYLAYRYHITIENFLTAAYISEKLTNALIYGCIPLYIGARNYKDFFPEENILALTGQISADLHLLRQLVNINIPIHEIKTNNLSSIKNKISLIQNITQIYME